MFKGITASVSQFKKLLFVELKRNQLSKIKIPMKFVHKRIHCVAVMLEYR